MLSITQTSEKIIVCKCGNDYLQTPMPNLQYYNSTFFFILSYSNYFAWSQWIFIYKIEKDGKTTSIQYKLF